jgi:urease subunit gamma/beta
MHLTPLEEDRLAIFSAAELARRVRAAGTKLNQPEAVAIICDAMLLAARLGAGYAACVAAGRSAVGEEDVLDGVRDLIPEVRLEVLLEEGSRLIVLVDPLGPGPDPVIAGGTGE